MLGSLCLYGGLTLLAAIVGTAYYFTEKVAPWDVKGKRILITGGSSGVRPHSRTQRDSNSDSDSDSRQAVPALSQPAPRLLHRFFSHLY